MKYLAPILVLFSLIALHDPTGKKVWVNTAAITSVVEPVSCGPHSGSKVNTGDTFLCVQETVDQVVNLLQSNP